MSKGIVVTTRLEPELVDQFDALAERTGRSRASLLAEAARDFAEEQAAFLAFVEFGARDIEEGRCLDAAETKAWLRQMMNDAQSRMDRPAAA